MQYNGWDGDHVQAAKQEVREVERARKEKAQAPLIKALEEIRDILTPAVGVGEETVKSVVEYINEVLEKET